MPISLRLRLMVSHLAVLLTGMLVAGVLAWLLTEKIYLSNQTENLLAQAQLIAEELSGTPLPLISTQPYSQTTNVLPGIHTRLLNENGGVVFSLPLLPGEGIMQTPLAEQNNGVSPDELLARDEIQQALQGHPAATVRRVESNGGGRVLYAAAPVQGPEGDRIGIVYLATPLPFGGLPAEVLFQLIGAILTAGILAGGVGYFLALRIARPLEELAQAAKRVGDGNLHQQVPSSSRVSELQDLGKAFNAMTGELERSEQARDAFLADVTHELRTPLTVIQGTIETLEDGAWDDLQGRAPLLSGMQRETDRLIRMVNNLLLLTRAEAGALSLHLQPVDLYKLARQRCELFSKPASRRKVSLQVADETTGKEQRSVLGDPDALAQVLDNLLENAIRHSPPGEVVFLLVSPAEKNVQVTIVDRGEGIPAEHLPFIFERFYRIDSSRDRKSGGTGLGLAITRSLVLAHGGSIQAASQPGQGTTMILRLPLAELLQN